MAKKEEIKTSVWVFWILLAIIGVALLFAGIQSSLLGGSMFYVNVHNINKSRI